MDAIRSRALELTRRLVRVRSCSRTPGERQLSDLLVRILREIGRETLEYGTHPVEGDELGREVVWALLRGGGRRTVVLMCHYDTVDVGDYGPLREVATEPDALREGLLAMRGELDALTRQHLGRPDEWLFGRGAVDMKSGIAAHLVALERLCERASHGERLPGNVVLLCTPDEESESLGILSAIQWLARLRAESGLELIGAINTDYTSPLYPGDERRVVYSGTVGKLLPCVYVRGLESHAGEPYSGFDADLLSAAVVRAISMRSDLADGSGGRVAPPPVVLRSADFKDRYDVQLPFDAYALINYLTLEASPAQVLERLARVVSGALRGVVEEVYRGRVEWSRRAGFPQPDSPPEPRVLTYSELLGRARSISGEREVARRTEQLSAELAARGADLRARSALLVREVWGLSGLSGPAAVLSFAPPYYPHVPPEDGPVEAAAAAVAAAHGVEVRPFYPYISDASYLSLRRPDGISALRENTPVWSDEPGRGLYSLPLERMREVDLPTVNVGVWGLGAHKREERVHVPYSCGVVPRMVIEIVERVLEDGDG